ncbi:hypothetical protein LINPERPRIM_LOCUS35803 [Linum perenne]
MAHHIVMMLITLTTLSLVSLSISPAPSPGVHVPYVMQGFKDLMCAHYDPQATAESIKSDPKITALCDSKTNSAKCLDFLGNKPNADPAFAIKSDCKTVQELLTIQATLAKRTTVPELKESFGSCAMEFDKAVKNLDNVEAACDQKITKQATALLGDVASNLQACDKAFEGVPEIKKKYAVKDANDGALEAIYKIVQVAKKFNE